MRFLTALPAMGKNIRACLCGTASLSCGCYHRIAAEQLRAMSQDGCVLRRQETRLSGRSLIGRICFSGCTEILLCFLANDPIVSLQKDDEPNRGQQTIGKPRS